MEADRTSGLHTTNDADARVALSEDGNGDGIGRSAAIKADIIQHRLNRIVEDDVLAMQRDRRGDTVAGIVERQSVETIPLLVRAGCLAVARPYRRSGRSICRIRRTM